MRTKLIRNILTVMLSAAAATTATAQTQVRLDAPHGWSIGTNFGLADFWGNVGTKSVIDHYNNSLYSSNMHGMGGMFVRYSMSPAFALKLAANYGVLYATDAWNYKKAMSAANTGMDAYQRYARNQDIKDVTWEGSLELEWSPRRMNLLNAGSQKSSQPYIHAGVGYFHYTPYGTLNGDWVKLHDLHLEGDGFSVAGMPSAYKLGGICIPVGVGYKFDIGQHLNLGIEYSYRLTFLGYMDDVSAKYIDPKYYSQFLTPAQAAVATAMANKSYEAIGPESTVGTPGNNRGNPSFKDSYSTISVVFFYKVKSHGIAWWGD
ncbi:MAG: hypothetical protein P4L41_08440 [Flavipsychrobacter sp.]|nr:hypothetical protein [Flavipsychrobacter sp.]